MTANPWGVRVLGRVRDAVRRRGPLGALAAAAKEIVSTATSSHAYARLTLSRREFSFAGRRYRYFVHPYNQTWRNERAVEVPIVRAEVESRPGARILEVGNVLSHYFPWSHDRVDKYERAEGVQNVDIVDFQGGPYDLIITISTLEHVGYDDDTQEPDKPLRAIRHLQTLLVPGGTLLASLPLGYNPHLDRALREERVPFDCASCLRRISADNRWQEVAFAEIAEAQLHHPFRGINGLVIARFGAAGEPIRPGSAGGGARQ